jgi:uncharacterized protein (TIGR02186 family)
MVRRAWIAGLLLGFCLAGLTPARGADLVASLSNHLVAITTGFTGANVLLFGATDGQGDVVVVVRGPLASQVVRRRGRVLGLWINERETAFAAVPGFYAVASSRPLPEIMPPPEAQLHEIGIDNVPMPPIKPGTAAEIAEFRAALIRSRRAAGLYVVEPGAVRFLGNRLFRTDVWIPANAPVGSYTVSFFLIRDGEVVSAESTPLLVSKVGIEARIFDFAYRYAFAYGVLAVIVAGVAGWLANVVYRRA